MKILDDKTCIRGQWPFRFIKCLINGKGSKIAQIPTHKRMLSKEISLVYSLWDSLQNRVVAKSGENSYIRN